MRKGPRRWNNWPRGAKFLQNAILINGLEPEAVSTRAQRNGQVFL